MDDILTEQREICLNCEHSTPILESDACICEFKGVVKAEGYCRKFSFDLLKLTPRTRKSLERDFLDISL